MVEQVKITNKTRVSFRRAGLRFPANGHVIVTADDVTDDQKAALSNEPRLEIEPYEGETSTPKKAGKKPAKKATAKTGTQKAEAAHARAMTAARKIKDPVKRQAAQDKANATLAKAQAEATNE